MKICEHCGTDTETKARERVAARTYEDNRHPETDRIPAKLRGELMEAQIELRRRYECVYNHRAEDGAPAAKEKPTASSSTLRKK